MAACHQGLRVCEQQNPHGKGAVLIKATCSHRRFQVVLCELPFKQGFLAFVEISATRMRTIPQTFISKDCRDLISVQQWGTVDIPKQTGALQ
ncbi:Glutaredoxin-1 [Plecturocebus cupreus]